MYDNSGTIYHQIRIIKFLLSLPYLLLGEVRGEVWEIGLVTEFPQVVYQVLPELSMGVCVPSELFK